MTVIEYQLAKAKVNLALHVVSKRNDGFHELDSLVCFPKFGDQIICRKSSVPNLSISGNFKNNISCTDNIILRVLRQLSSPNSSMSVQLEKNIPVSAGLGGGSADAAAVIRGFKNLWGKTPIERREILHLGADVPACMDSRYLKMQGIGENIVKLRSELNFFLLLVNSGNPVSTKDVFFNLKSTQNAKLDKLSNFKDLEALVSYLRRQRNDLEEAAFSVDSNLGSIKDYVGKLKGCSLARLSGSGGTVFGIFGSQIDLFEAYHKIIRERMHWWVHCSPVSLANSGYDVST